MACLRASCSRRPPHNKRKEGTAFRMGAEEATMEHQEGRRIIARTMRLVGWVLCGGDKPYL
jgi:hypothetical protein